MVQEVSFLTLHDIISSLGMTRIHLTEEETYDIFRNVFHNEEDALAATIQLFGGESWDEEIIS